MIKKIIEAIWVIAVILLIILMVLSLCFPGMKIINYLFVADLLILVLCNGAIKMHTESMIKKQQLWYDELKKIIWEEYGGKAELDNTNFEDWKSYYEDGLTPAEAIIEDLKNL